MTNSTINGKEEALSETVDTSSIFIGSRAENAEVFEDLIIKAFRNHVDWRKAFHPEDKDIIDDNRKKTPGYQNGIKALNDGLDSLMRRLNDCIPFYSHRYIGHMCSDTTMASMAGYFAAMLYNTNNIASVTKGISPTIKLEMEAIAQLATMIGYTDGKHWGHLTSGGTIANFEALWVARNMHYLPIAMYWTAQELNLLEKLEVEFVNGKSVPMVSVSLWQLLNISSDEILRLYSALQNLCPDPKNAQAAIMKHSLTRLGCQEYTRRLSISFDETLPDGVVIIPSTGHYSWVKLCGAVGIGSNQLIRARNDSKFRLDPEGLYSLIKSLCEQRRTIIACVVALGSTEVSALDPLHKILEVKRRVEHELGVTFYLHVDGAWGGYAISATRCSDGSRKEFSKKLTSSEHQIEMWPDEDIYRALCAVEFSDSITIDPHKLGYVPYPSGSIIFRNGFVRQLLDVQDVPYAFNGNGDSDDKEIARKLGQYTMEGSKPGAAAAAVWLSHQVLPLNKTGYGNLIEQTCNTARMLRQRIKTRNWNPFKIVLLPSPDLNIVCFGISHPLIRALSDCNALVRNVFYAMSTSPMEFMVSETKLLYQMYGEALHPLIESLGFYDSGDCYMNAGGINVIRCTVMDPMLCNIEKKADDTAALDVIGSFLDSMQSTMEAQVNTMLFQKSAQVTKLGDSFTYPQDHW